MLGERPPARILLEASTESEWVARHLESLGHEVVVDDPNYAPMYADRARRTQTDTRDALVRARTRYLAFARALVRRDQLRVPTSSRAWVPTRIAELDLSPTLTTELPRLFAVFGPLTAQSAVADARIAAFVKEKSIAALPTMAPGGRRSGEKRQLDHMTKAGNGRLRWLLVEAVWTMTFVSILATMNQQELEVLRDLMQAGKITSAIDRRYPMAELPAAVEYLEKGRARGKVIVNVVPSQ